MDMADQTPTGLIDPALADADDGPIVLAGQLRVPGRRRTARHQHRRGQLLGAHQGLLRIEAGNLQWLLPAGHVAWIPPLLPHALLGADGFDGWSLYVRADAGLDLPPLPRIFQPDALLQAALKTTDQAERTKDYQQAQKVVIDEAAYVYLFQKNYQLAMNKEVKGFTFNPMLEQVFNIATMSK